MSVIPVDNPSLKWKGPVISGTTVPIEYDVDDPTFCSPRSVLSGLASGFCERWAVAHPEFVVAYNGGNSTTLNWNDTNSSAAYRTSIVSNFVENIIVHDAAKMTMASAFCETNGDFLAPEHPTAGSSSNYMTFMDNMITQLIASGGYYTTSATNSPSYSAFNQLAASASANAPAVSACDLPVSNASAYTSQFLPAYPAAWAKERKWMLEQLRYQQEPGQIDNVTGAMGYGIATYSATGPIFYRTLPAVSVTSAMAVLTSISISGGSHVKVNSDGAASNQYIPPVTAASALNVMNGAHVYAQFRVFDSPESKVVQMPDPVHYQNPYFGYGLMTTMPGTNGATVTAGLYFGAPTGPGMAERVCNDSGYEITAGTETNPTNQNRIIVKSGATVTLTGGTISYLSVSSGGVASIGAGAWIQSCNVMSGGLLIPIDTTMQLNLLKADYRVIYGNDIEDYSTATPIVFNVVVPGVSSTPVNSGRYIVKSGGTLLCGNTGGGYYSIDAIALGGGKVINEWGGVISSGGALGGSGTTVPGGIIELTSDIAEAYVSIGSGGSLLVSANYGGGCRATVYKGGVVSFGPNAVRTQMTVEYGGSLLWDSYYNTSSADRIQQAVESFFIHIPFGFGMKTPGNDDLVEGWNTIQTTIEGGTATIAGFPGITPTADGKSAITHTPYIDPYNTTYGYAGLSNLNDAIEVREGFQLLAVNGGTAKPVPVDVYPGFKLRQNET